MDIGGVQRTSCALYEIIILGGFASDSRGLRGDANLVLKRFYWRTGSNFSCFEALKFQGRNYKWCASVSRGSRRRWF